ncbi:MAG TPA: hypothetical protein VGJ79_00650 [Candidatus Dormibacteraeota bacterium]|jgi:hypothetical protein
MSDPGARHLAEGWEEMWTSDTDHVDRLTVDGGHIWRSIITASGESKQPLMMSMVFVPYSEEELTPDD